MPSIENSPAPARADAGADSPAGFTDHLHAMFPTLISESEYPHFAREKASLLECIYRIRDEDAEGREQSRSDYAMGYTSFFSRTDLYNLPEFQPLATFIYGKAIKYAEFQKWDLQNFELQLSTLWINVNPTHAHHAEHVHPFSHISGVFYVSCVPGCGHIVFRDPRPVRIMAPVPTTESNDTNTDVLKINPAEGVMLLFPAWLTHGVEQNRAEHDRVSLSFNLALQRRSSPSASGASGVGRGSMPRGYG